MEAKEQATKKRRLKQEERAATGPTEKDLAEIDAQTEEHAKWQALLESGTRVGEAAKTTWTPAQIRGKMKRCENAIKRIQASLAPPPAQGNVARSKGPAVVDKIFRTRKIKVHPSNDEAKVIRDWMRASRFVYNACVAHYHKTQNSTSTWITAGEQKNLMRDHIRSTVIPDKTWLQKIHNTIIDGAVVDFVNAYQANVAKLRKKLKKNETFSFKMQFRSQRHMVQETLSIGKREWAQKSGPFAFLKYLEPSADNSLPAELQAQAKLTRTRLGDVYIAFPSPQELQHSQAFWDVVALDPGVRTFQTGFCSNGVVIEWGANDMTGVFRRLRNADKLQSRIANEKDKSRRRRMRHAWLRMLLKIRRRIDHLHKCLCAFLVRAFKVILLPEFESQRMSSRTTRKIGNRTVRSMLTWGHYRFRELLKAKVLTVIGCTLVICDEHYTSKTCGSCGQLHHKLGASKTFHCPHCGYTADRDANGARNILLRFIAIHNIAFTLPSRPTTTTTTTTTTSPGDEAEQERAGLQEPGAAHMSLSPTAAVGTLQRESGGF